MLDLTDTKESGGVVPPGTYYLIADDAEMKDTKAGDGSYISVKYRILEGAQEGRFLFHMFNIKNPNPKAVEIGMGQLKTFMKCSGATDFKLAGVGDLLGFRCDAVVKTREDDYGAKAVISYFKPHSETSEQKKAASPF